MRRKPIPVILALCISPCFAPACARAQDPVESRPQSKQSPVEQLMAALAKEKVELDRKRKTVTIPVFVNRPTHDLEYLLIYVTGKKHESLLVTRSKPSVIQTGLFALGLAKGKNASFRKKEPPPTEAEMKKGVDPFVLVPPKGPALYMTVAYKDKAGKTVECAIEDLLLDWFENLSVTDNQWIFLGGRMAQMYRGEPAVFMADYEGNLISVCYKYPSNHLLTMVHSRARDEMNWAKTGKCPPPGTEMKLTFHVNKPKVIVEREARMRKAAEERKRRGDRIDLSSRPGRNPARQGSGVQPPEKPKKKADEPKKAAGEKERDGGDGR